MSRRLRYFVVTAFSNAAFGYATIKKFPGSKVYFIFFMDEKVLTLELLILNA